MLYWLLYQELFVRYVARHRVLSPFRVFQYQTFRIAFASLTALFLALILGPWLIRRLKEFQIGQFIREDGPESHQKKAGTPTMGGILVVISFLFPTLLWADLTNAYVWIAVLATAAFAAVGFADDYLKIKNRRNLGLTGKTKILLQILISFGVGVSLLLLFARGLYSTELIVPFFKNFKPDLLIDRFLHSPYTLPLAFLPFFLFVIMVLVGSSNAVNLTDGLDGLASGLIIITGGALTALVYVTGHAVFADYLGLQYIKGIGEVAIFCGAVVGAAIGFLWWNAHPAEIFMGDVGSLALGGAMGTVAVLAKQELLLPLIGGVFVAEALSVILQVGSFKLRGKRIFRMAPLHHHFEFLGWKESQVIIRFWIAGLIVALFALATLKLR